MIVFACPHCGQRLKAKAEQGGDETHCPKCRKEIVIPAGPESADEKTEFLTMAELQEREQKKKAKEA